MKTIHINLSNPNCNHQYQYIATERIPTDNWNYGMREYKEEVIVYCPICHTHSRMSVKEWEDYHGLAVSINRFMKDKEVPICTFDKDKVATFTTENCILNLGGRLNECNNNI